MDISLIVVGKGKKETWYGTISEVIGYKLRINDTIVVDITNDIASICATIYDFGAVWAHCFLETRATFELKTGEKYENIKIINEWIE